MAETAVQCPWCQAIIPVPINVTLTGAPHQLAMTCDPDLADVWSHAWTHQAEGDTGSQRGGERPPADLDL